MTVQTPGRTEERDPDPGPPSARPHAPDAAPASSFPGEDPGPPGSEPSDSRFEDPHWIRRVFGGIENPFTGDRSLPSPSREAGLSATQRGLLRWLGLGIVLAFTWTVARIPHTDLGTSGVYPYPRHMDEWLHWGKAAAAARQGTLAYANPWRGGTAGTSQAIPFYHEIGFHGYLATLHEVTGIPFLLIFAYGPALTLCVVALGMYAVGRPHGYGLEAALFTALIPTTPRFLGPAFLVPITFSFVLFVPIILVATRRKRRGALPLMLLLCTAIWTLHARAALFVLGPVLLACAARMPRRPGQAAGLAWMALLPLFLAVRIFLDTAVSQTFREPPLPIDRTVFEGFGLATLPLFALGAGWGVSGVRDRLEPAVLAASGVVAMGFVFVRPFTGWDPGGMYSRAHMLFFLTAAPVAGYGAARLRRAGFQADLPAPRIADRAQLGPRFYGAVTLLVTLAVVGTALAGGVQTHLDEPYYTVIQEEDWETFQWMERNLPADRDRVLMLPWKALAFGAYSERTVHSAQFPGDPVNRGQLSMRVAAGVEVPLEELRSHGVEVIYTRAPIGGAGLEKVHDRVFLVEDAGE